MGNVFSRQGIAVDAEVVDVAPEQWVGTKLALSYIAATQVQHGWRAGHLLAALLLAIHIKHSLPILIKADYHMMPTGLQTRCRKYLLHSIVLDDKAHLAAIAWGEEHIFVSAIAEIEDASPLCASVLPINPGSDGEASLISHLGWQLQEGILTIENEALGALFLG